MNTKSIAFALMSELMKNSRKSDRELAKKLGVSQPTITRMRTRLEREGYIREYTLVPDFKKLGFHLAAFSFLRVKPSATKGVGEEVKNIKKRALESFPQVVVAEKGRGFGCEIVFVSFHRDYQEYLDYMDNLKMEFRIDSDCESFLISLDTETPYRYLTFATLAKCVKQSNSRNEE